MIRPIETINGGPLLDSDLLVNGRGGDSDRWTEILVYSLEQQNYFKPPKYETGPSEVLVIGDPHPSLPLLIRRSGSHTILVSDTVEPSTFADVTGVSAYQGVSGYLQGLRENGGTHADTIVYTDHWLDTRQDQESAWQQGLDRLGNVLEELAEISGQSSRLVIALPFLPVEEGNRFLLDHGWAVRRQADNAIGIQILGQSSGLIVTELKPVLEVRNDVVRRFVTERNIGPSLVVDGRLLAVATGLLGLDEYEALGLKDGNNSNPIAKVVGAIAVDVEQGKVYDALLFSKDEIASTIDDNIVSWERRTELARQIFIERHGGRPYPDGGSIPLSGA